MRSPKAAMVCKVVARSYWAPIGQPGRIWSLFTYRGTPQNISLHPPQARLWSPVLFFHLLISSIPHLSSQEEVKVQRSERASWEGSSKDNHCLRWVWVRKIGDFICVYLYFHIHYSRRHKESRFLYIKMENFATIHPGTSDMTMQEALAHGEWVYLHKLPES